MIKILKIGGQITMGVAIIGLLGTVVASFITSWGTASKRVSLIEKEVGIIEEREDNHYQEVQKSLNRIEKKLDSLNK